MPRIERYFVFNKAFIVSNSKFLQTLMIAYVIAFACYSS